MSQPPLPPPQPPGWGPPAAYGGPSAPAYVPHPTGTQVAAMPVPHPRPETYPHLLRTVEWDRQWWRPLLGVPAVVLWFFVVASIVLAPVLIAGLVLEGAVTGRGFDVGDVTSALDLGSGLPIRPAAMLYLNLTLASIILVVMALMRWLHHLRPGWVVSVRPGVRWGFFWACLGLAVLAVLAQIGLSLLLPGQDEGEIGGRLNELTGNLVAVAVVVALTTPFQAIGEEYLFRGYLMMATGSLLGWFVESTRVSPETARRVGTVLAVLISSLLFGLAHGVQNAPLFLDRFLFGVIAGVLVVRTGGLEAGMALHILNNYAAFTLSLLFGDVAKSLTVSEVPWTNIWLTITQNGVYLVLVLLVARRMGVSRRTRGVAQTS